MGGGLLQLVAYGAQDAYLSGNPQITFWKGLFKRHTNFAMEPFRINLTGQAGWGVKHSAIIGRHADLLYSTYLTVTLPVGGVFNNDQARLGYNLINYVELDIGGQVIDRLYGEWLYLWDTLTSDTRTALKLHQMVGASAAPGTYTVPSVSNCLAGASGQPGIPSQVVIPLSFFYTKNPGCALPLIALQYHEVKINILWNDAKSVAGNFNNSLAAPSSAAVYIDYIYLDTEERRRMAQNSHEYLIEQLQYNEDKGVSSWSNRIDLTFNHPVKELVWVVQPSEYTQCRLAQGLRGSATRLQPFTYDQNAVFEQHLQINGQDRHDRRYGQYFNTTQLYQHHTGSAHSIYASTNTIAAVAQPGIYGYSFALKPEEHQPSGTCNFSRIDTATLVMKFANSATLNPDADQTYEVRVYAVNYNILRIMSGMGGLAYSN